MIRIGIIGMGYRGTIHFKNLLLREDVIVMAIVDPHYNEEEIKRWCNEKGKAVPALYSSQKGYHEMMSVHDIDGVILSVPWDLFTPILLELLPYPCYIGVEASSIDKIEDIERLQKSYQAHNSEVMILENACYHRDVMAVFQMVGKGLFGELVHLRGGYEHDLRKVKFDEKFCFGPNAKHEARWRTAHSLQRNGDLYPSHGIGPIAYILDINRGNRFVSISSFASKSRGLGNYLKRHKGVDHLDAKLPWKLGDVITSTLTTQRGETIILTHNTNTSRPYSLGFRVQGTDGIWIQENGNHLHIESLGESVDWMENPDQILRQHDAVCWKRYHKEAAKTVRHDMDFFVLNDFLLAVDSKTSPKFDIYDLLSWMAISPLSEESIKQGGLPIPFPDFTNEQWRSRESFYKE
ncbi:hypothetical protein K5X82_05830 [Halosquirtibacter xylanolyticus]|uniref:Gfo/Idh/MocA family protein n=1 Tax=Halosquirtibacter xylanolyticus TaxID=3374599 RepID=UPI00374834EE|nr:hypothetical protein K5X82_05830 [Prolixibacteraceae bacterium]